MICCNLIYSEKDEGITHVVVCLSSNCEALSSNSCTTTTKLKKKIHSEIGACSLCGGSDIDLSSTYIEKTLMYTYSSYNVFQIGKKEEWIGWK
jgi:hypothetical protein